MGFQASSTRRQFITTLAKTAGPASVWQQDTGLLVLRIIVPGSLLLKHGLEKIFTFSSMAQHFPDPLHIGPVPSLVIALISDAVCSVLLVAGLATRWASLFSFLNIFVAWATVHQFQFFGKGAEHGEVIVLYLAAMLTLFLAGPGRFSLDDLIVKRRLTSTGKENLS